jgi:hypothetical protein
MNASCTNRASLESLELRRLLSATINVVARSGDSAGNGVFGGGTDFSGVSLNDTGQTGFIAVMTGTSGGSSDDTGVFRAGPGGLVQIAREGQAVPGVASATFNDFRAVAMPAVAINGNGLVGFHAPTNSLAYGEFIGNGSTLSKIVLTGDLLPEGDATFEGVFRTAPINASGQMSFIGNFLSGGRAGDFRGGGGGLMTIARFGALSPDGTNQYSITSVNATPAINDSGLVALRTGFRTAQGAPAGTGVVVSDGSNATIYDRSGTPIPGGTGSFAGNNSNTIAFNNVGQVAFLDGVTASSSYAGLFVGANGATQLIARTGQPLPGSSGITYTSFYDYDFNSSGTFVLDGVEGNTNDLMIGDASHGFTRIVGGNDPLPDGDGNFPNSFGEPTINNAGQVAFQSLIQFGSGNFPNDTGIFFYDASNGGLQVGARLGQPLLGSTIKTLNFQTGTANRAGGDVLVGHSFSGLNNAGQVAFQFSLADGRYGVAVWTPQATVPPWLLPGPGAVYTFANNTLSVTAGTVTFTGDAGSFNPGVNVAASGSSTILFASNQHLGSLALADSSSASLAAGSDRLLSVTALSIGDSAALDLNDNDLIVDYPSSSQLGAVQAWINSARAGGAWTGPGITSSAARNANPRSTTLGVMEASEYKSIYGLDSHFDDEAIDSTAVLVKYTYYGDTDFNGLVNFDDYSRIDAGFNQHRSGWLNGDLDGNGIIDFDDYSLIDLAFNTQSTPLSRPSRSRGGG